MTTINLTVNVSELDSDDVRAIRYVASQENRNREISNLDLLDLTDRQAIKAHYETYIAGIVKGIHDNFVSQAVHQVDADVAFKSMRSDWLDATPEQREAARQALRS